MRKTSGIVTILLSIILVSCLWFGGLFVTSLIDNDSTVVSNNGNNTVNKNENTNKESLTTTNINKLDNSKLFHYNQLSQNEKNIYDSLLNGFINLENEITMEKIDSSSLSKIFKAVLNDHSEIFWVEKSFKYTLKDSLFDSKYCIYPNYFFDKKEIKNMNNQIQFNVDTILNDISSLSTDSDKIKRVYETIILQTTYDIKAYKNSDTQKINESQNIDSALINKTTVCAGYAKTIHYILNRCGIETIYVTGEAGRNENTGAHAWNIVKCDGQYYYLDATWGDPTYTLFDKELSSISYIYLLANDSVLNDTHKIDSTYFDYPECTNTHERYHEYNS